MKGTKVTYTPAEIVSVAKDGIVVSADGVYDYNLEKFQEQVNADILEEQENIQLRITHLTPEDVGALPFDTPYAESTSPGGPANSAEKLNTDAGSSKKPVYFENGIPVEVDHSVNKDVPADAVFTDTKNTAGATDSELKLFLIGATELTENPQTHSQDSAYVGTDGCLYSGNKKVITDVSDKADKVNTVTNVEYNNKKFTKTINENTSDIVDINKIKEDLELSKSDIELENVTNDALVKRSEMGVANGVATLGSDGKVPSSLLPGYVDDVIELLDMSETSPQSYSKGDFYYNTISKKLFEATLNNQWDDGIVPPTGKIYTNLNNNKTYRWGGSEMVVISETVAIGTTTGTAFDGKEGYDHVTNNDIHVTTQNKENWNNKYLKPNEGIPKSDLSNEVKEALDNANSALQEETDPTVPAWAKEPTKPSYDLDEVPDGANRKIPTKVSELENDSHFTGNLGTVTKVKIGTQEHTPTNGIVELPAYPTTLPASDVPNWAKEPNKPSYTLDEIPDGDTRKLANKVDKIAGKDLSTNDYTNDDKTKLGNIEAGAQVHRAPTTAEVKQALGTGNGTSKYLREDGNWVTPPDTTYNNATTSEAGLMSTDDKNKLDGIESGALAHKTPTTLEVKNALGTGNGTTKYLREDGTWLVPPDTKYLSKVPEENGVDVSLVTTGDKYIWNHKLDNISDLSTIRSNATKGAEAKEDLIDYDAFVDLGLPSGTLWAKCNIGANKETEYGYYYQYGKGAALYAETLNQSNYTGTENPLSSEYDTAVQVLGGPWHMPTRVQMQELTANTTYQWVTNYKGSGINGDTFTATNGAVLFIPAAGFWYNGSQYRVGSDGLYWGSSPNGSINAYSLSFGNGIQDVYERSRKGGYSVRPVCEIPPSKLLRKVDKVFGKDLSTNDYTSAEKSKLGGIEAGALVHKAPTSTEVKNALGTGSGTDKFLREDGTWQTPNYTDISYSNKKLTKTVNGSTSNVVSTDTLKSDMNLNKVGNFKAVSTEANLGLTDTEKGNARANIGAGTSSLVIGTTSNTAADGKIVDNHIKNTSNPHSVTKELVGLGNVKNLSITVTSTSVSDGTNTFNKYVHPSGTNPHGTTKSDVGLGNVTNDAQVKRTEMGANNGVATLDNTGKVPSSQLPSYVDDIIEGYLNTDGLFYDRLTVQIGNLYWATMNVGANNITDTGLYFQWGDTQGYTASQVGSGAGLKYFGWADYKYGNGTSSPGAAGMTKYNSTDGKTVLDLSDDAVRANWGGNWRMPTTAEYAALGAAVNFAWTADYQGSGVSGLILTDKTDSSKVLFFPAAGYCYDDSVYGGGSYGFYWSSSVYSSNVQNAYRLYFNSSNVYWQGYDTRFNGFAVRGVSSTAPTIIPEVGKIYVDKATNLTYRWSGSNYIEISKSLALGETSSTAYRGDRGKLAYDHISNTNNPHNVTKSQIGLNNVVNTGDSNTPVSGGTTKFTTGGAYTELNKKVDKVSGKGLSTNDYTTDEKNKLAGIAAGAEVNVQSDWNATSGDAFIKNKPTIPSEVTESTVSGWGFTKNTGTITGIKMNGSSKGTSGVIDLGTVITAHQDISGKVDKTTTVNGHALNGNVSVTKSDVGLGSVGNFKAVSTVASQSLSDTEKANARANIGAGTSSLTLGTGASNAYYGDKGKTAYDHASDANRLTTSKKSGLYKIAVTNLGHVLSVTAVAKSDITGLDIPSSDGTGASGTWPISISGNANYASSAGSVAWANITGKPSTFTPSSHTHNMNDIKWPGGHNLITSATANGQEWSIDCTPGTYTGTYWQVWRAATEGVNVSGTMLKVDCDTGKVSAPYGFVGNLSGTASTATNANYLISNTRMDYGWDGINYFNHSAANQSKAKVNDTPYSSATWTHILRFNHGNNAGYYTDLAIPFNDNGIYYKRVANGGLQNSTTNGGWISVLDNLNSSVSLSGSTLTVKINGTEKSLTNTNTWRGIQNNLTSDSTTDSLSAAQGKALNSKFSNYVLKSGDTMTGTLINTASPGFANEVAANSWAYIRFKSGTTSEWHVGTNSSTPGILGQANAFEIRDAKSSYTGIAVRCNTSSYGKLVVTAASGETSIGLRSGTSGNPQWVFGIIDSSNYRFGFYNTSGSAWRANFSQNGYLYLGDGNNAASERLHVSGNTRITGDIRIEGNDEYLGTGTGSQCHLLYDNTNKCLNFIFD